MFNLFRKKSPVSLFYHTDIHSHIIPGVDHGSPDVETSLQLIRAQMDMGIRDFIFTSHVTQGRFENTPQTLSDAFSVLSTAVKKQNLDINMAYSAEYRIDDLFLEQFGAGQVIPIHNEYILIENSFQQEHVALDDIIFNIELKEFTPILAHPERYNYYGDNPSHYERLHDAGVLFQVNLLSFTGYFGRHALANAMWLLKHDLIDFLGSDIHNMQHAEEISHFLRTKGYRHLAERLSGRILNDNF